MKKQLTFKNLKEELLKEGISDDDFSGYQFRLFVNRVQIGNYESKDDVNKDIQKFFEKPIEMNYKKFIFKVDWRGKDCFVSREKFNAADRPETF